MTRCICGRDCPGYDPFEGCFICARNLAKRHRRLRSFLVRLERTMRPIELGAGVRWHRQIVDVLAADEPKEAMK